LPTIARSPSVINALSVDVEEYYHGMEFERALSASELRQLPSRIEASMDRVLALFEARGVQATFFIVGCVAQAHPAMVRQIAARGHEVACHGYAHQLVGRQTPGEFRQDLRRARGVIEDLTGTAILGYRAPNYSIGAETLWAFDILAEEGFRYDSSVYPIHHDRYGSPAAPRFPYVLRDSAAGVLWEFPIGTVRALGMNFPIGGGGTFRLFPYSWFRRGLARVNRHEGRGIMFYFHPWELDPDQPRPRMPWSHSFRHYVNLRRQEAKLGRLLQDFAFAPARSVLGVA
jgi:polysaccharide deacetylase family protein (PEP-CTERM system associated)